ncbi:WYL domain-containing protein [Thermoactinomyces sp. CICC 10523]|uniref:WYL domain-containing protein n=1 Tax=Thermoactinomyces sp. CICC 10523 TaxID=2767428 RepID=UPI0018DB3681|nr:WYL domain-containing protein [Thermoactinomyces sp. CICC 10523]MBH8597291.1 WYL domain-containing protein [Thermoactinomyces sp. CICC 10523]
MPMRTVHSSSRVGMKEEVWIYKKNHAQQYINQMLEAEHGKSKDDYVIRIYDKEVFKRIREKQWHPEQKIIPFEGEGAVGEIPFSKVSSWLEMKKWVLGWGSAVELIQPAENRRELCEEIKT